MPTYNYKSRELIAKIVYYGPGRCGKTTNLQQIHARMRPETRSDLLSVATETDRTIYFDLLPLNLGTISGMKFMVRLFTVPGQVYYAETRKLVLRGADGIVFVADSQDHMMDENRQSLRDLKDNLAANGLDYATIPLVMQWNKRDLPHLISPAELDATLNDRKVKAMGAVASQGEGVLETLRQITLSVFNHVKTGGKTTAVRPQQAAPSNAPTMKIPTGGLPSSDAGARPGTWSAALERTSLDAPPVGRSAPRTPPPPPPSDRANPSASFTALPDPMVGHSVHASHRHAPQFAGVAVRPAAHLDADGPQPVKISVDMVVEEFRSLAVAQSQMAERLTTLEHELARIGRENQEIRELLSQQPHA